MPLACQPVENCPVFRFKKFPFFGTISLTEFEGIRNHGIHENEYPFHTKGRLTQRRKGTKRIGYKQVRNKRVSFLPLRAFVSLCEPSTDVDIRFRVFRGAYPFKFSKADGFKSGNFQKRKTGQFSTGYSLTSIKKP